MDIEAELQRLSQEARAKLDADKPAGAPDPEPVVAKGLDDAIDRQIDLSAREELPPSTGRVKANLRKPGSMPLGAKVVVAVAAVIAVLMLIRVVVMPLIYAAVWLGILAVVVFVALKLMGVDLGAGDEDKKE